MSPRHLRIPGITPWLAAVLLILAGCKAPAVRSYPADRGRPIDPASVAQFRQGVSTRAEAVQALGEPDGAVTSPAVGVSTLTWQYSHTDAAGSTTTTVIMKFGPDGKLLLKFLNQDSRNR